MKKILIPILIVLLASCNDTNPSGIINHVKENDPIPVFMVEDGRGGTFNSSEFIGKKSLLVFFNTGCGDCHRELPVVEQVWRGLKDDPEYMVVTIARKEPLNSIEAYWSRRNFTMPKYLDLEGEVFYTFANMTIPRLYVINPQGKVTWMAIEKLDIDASQLIEKIKSQQ